MNIKWFFGGNMLWQLIGHSDSLTIGVLVVLLLMSIIGWAIFFYKLRLLYSKEHQIQRVLRDIKQITSFDALIQCVQKHRGTLPGYFISKINVYVTSLATKKGITEYSHFIGRIEEHINQNIDEIIAYEESYISFLSISAALAPLLGLFGTVWGLIHSFIGISEKQVADIAVIAPGIAQALVTTLAGLMVAIPALALFNYLVLKVRHIEHQLMGLAQKIIMILE